MTVLTVADAQSNCTHNRALQMHSKLSAGAQVRRSETRLHKQSGRREQKPCGLAHRVGAAVENGCVQG